MKRLLAYLFIVLGLGFTFNLNAKAAYCLKKDFLSVHKFMSTDCGKLYFTLNISQYEKFKKLGQKISSKLIKQKKTDQFFETIAPAFENLALELKIVNQKYLLTEAPKSLFKPKEGGYDGGLTNEEEWLVFNRDDWSEVAVWTGVRNENGEWSRNWHGANTLEEALSASFYDCKNERKNSGLAFTDNHLCVPLYIKYKGVNARDTTDKEKIEFMSKYYGQDKTYNFFKYYHNYWALNDKSLIHKLQIVKAESSQTQKVAKKNATFCSTANDTWGYVVPGNYNCSKNENEVTYETFVLNFLTKNSDKSPSYIYNTLYYEFKYANLDISLVNDLIDKNKTLNNYKKHKKIYKTQIAKAEPSQTQKVAKKKDEFNRNSITTFVNSSKKNQSKLMVNNNIYFCDNRKSSSNKGNDYFISLKKGCKVRGKYEYGSAKRMSENDYILAVLDLNKNTKIDRFFKIRFNQLLSSYKAHGLNTQSIDNISFNSSSKTQIAKAEPTIIPKKKVKVAKVEDSTQEEFKPKKTNQDNEAPVIEIAEAITVDSQAYTIKGKVKDKSQIYLTIDGRQVDVKKGKFEFPGFVIDPSEGEVLKIVAIDRWQNKSEKTINIKVEFKQTANARSYEKPNPNNIRTKTDNDKIGIIIGIEKYQALSNLDAPYANRDANAFRAYATRALGIPNKNLKVLIDDEATRSGLLKSLKIWLPQMTRGKSKDIYIFFAGHGLASDDGKDLHILPQDGDPILLEDTALSRIEMFDLINKVSPKSVTMFFDTCYSGQTRSEQMLVAGLRPVRIVADEQDTPNNFTIFTASNYDQTSGSINEAEHGIFSYYLMKGLEGNADANKDKELTNGELIAYLKNNVSQEAFTQNRSQEPMLAGDPDKVLMSYR